MASCKQCQGAYLAASSATTYLARALQFQCKGMRQGQRVSPVTPCGTDMPGLGAARGLRGARACAGPAGMVHPGLEAGVAWAPGDRRLRALLLPAGLMVASGSASAPITSEHV